MKKFLLIAGLLIAGIFSAQQQYTRLPLSEGLYFFPGASDSSRFFIGVDHSQPSNIWEIGNPHKVRLNAPPVPNHLVLITDTSANYPNRNTSSFTIGVIASPSPGMILGGWMGFQLAVTMKYDMDSVHDGGIIEYKCRSNIYSSWTNIMNVTQAVYGTDRNFFRNSVTAMNTPCLTGRNLSWTNLNMNIGPTINPGDTAFVRFTFVSDSFNTNREGWMIGQMNIAGLWEGISEYSLQPELTLFPNPANSMVQLHLSEPHTGKLESRLLDMSGRLVYSREFQGDNFSIDCSALPPGMYNLEIRASEFIINKKIVITHE